MRIIRMNRMDPQPHAYPYYEHQLHGVYYTSHIALVQYENQQCNIDDIALLLISSDIALGQ